MENDPDRLASLERVGKRYGPVVALDGLDLEVRRGELLALLGPNGAGKSTAVHTLLGLVRPDSGRARLFGLPPTARPARRRVGVMMQEVALAPELRVREQIDLVAASYDAPLTPEDAMDLTGITRLALRPYGKLSGGQKRQVQLAMAICGRPRLLFLDEPSTGLDVDAREAMWGTLRRLVDDGCGIVLTTHYLDEAEALADRVSVLACGRVVAEGTVDELRALVSRKRIRCATSLSVDTIAAWPDVAGVARDPAGLLVLSTSSAEAIVRRLLDADPALGQLEVERAGLADALRSVIA